MKRGARFCKKGYQIVSYLMKLSRFNRKTKRSKLTNFMKGLRGSHYKIREAQLLMNY